MCCFFHHFHTFINKKMVQEGKILIADDNDELLIALSVYLSPHFELIETVRNPNLIPGKLEEHDFDLVLLDMIMPEMDRIIEKVYRAYLSHSIRGKKGADATDTDMEDNCKKAVEFGEVLESYLLDW